MLSEQLAISWSSEAEKTPPFFLEIPTSVVDNQSWPFQTRNYSGLVSRALTPGELSFIVSSVIFTLLSAVHRVMNRDMACTSSSFGRFRCSFRTLPETVMMRSRGGNLCCRTSSANGSSTSIRHSRSGSIEGASKSKTGSLASFGTILATAQRSSSYNAWTSDDKAIAAPSLVL